MEQCDEDVAQFVGQCILDTIKHSPFYSPVDDWGKLNNFFLDCDLSILSSPYEEESKSGMPSYASYAEWIRKEYIHMTIEKYCEGRHKVMQKFLEKPQIYLVEGVRESYEEKARENIAKEMEKLADGEA